MDNKKNSYNFETHCIDLHNKTHKLQTAIHWRSIPEDMLYDSGFITDFNCLRLMRKQTKNDNKNNSLQEYGLDGISVETINDKMCYHGLQMKLHDTKSYLTGHCLGTFWQVLLTRFFNKNELSKGYLYHTNKLQINVEDDIKNNKRIIANKINIDEFYKSLNVNDIVNNDVVINNNEFVLRDYQKQALEKLNENWSGIKSLILPCGTGKTHIISEYLKNKHYKNIFIFSPLRIHASQILNYVSKFLPNHKKMLADCDGILDINEILNLLKENCIISTTFKSAKDTISKLFDENNNFNTEDSILIVDEAHNLTVDNNDEDTENIINIINKFKKALLVTATPPTCIEEVFNCQPIFKYSMNEAIKNNHICDYQIYLPSVMNGVVDIDKPDELLKLDDDLCKKGLFLINGMLKTGSKRCIVYLSNTDECKAFKKVISEIVNQYHSLPYWISTITSDTKSKSRETIIDNFQKDDERLDTLKFLLSIRILDEGVDIVRCDSVFITKIGESTSDIKIVQRMCRANRLDKTNKLKKANCFMWCNDLSKTINSLQLLKENDIDFIKKITVCNGNYEKNNEKDIVVKEQNVKLIEHITVKCLSFSEMFEYKKNLLFEFVDLNNRTPKKTESFKNINIGSWFYNQKKKINLNTDETYIKLSQNIIVKEELDRYLNPNTFDEIHEIFLEFVNLNNRTPTQKESFKNINVGKWFSNQKSKINANTDEMYIKLSQNNIAKEELNKYLNKEKKEKIYTFAESFAIFLEFVNLNNRTPTNKESFKNINIGLWFHRQKNKINTVEDEIYVGLSQNIIVKNELDKYLKKEKKEKIYTFDESFVVFLEFVDLNNRTPKKTESFKNINIGTWFQTQKKKIKTNKNEIYIKLSQNIIVKNELNRYLNKKNKKNIKN